MKKLAIALALGLAASCAVWAQSTASSAAVHLRGHGVAKPAHKDTTISAPPRDPAAERVCETAKGLAEKTDRDFKRALSDKKISPKEHEDYNKRSEAFKKMYDDAVKDKRVTQAECDKLLAEAYKEATALREMIAVGAESEACFADFKKTLAEAAQVVEDGIKKKKINAAEKEKYKQAENSLQKRLDGAMRDRSVSKKECESLLKDAKSELESAKAMAAK